VKVYTEFTVPADTPETSPAKLEIKLSAGTITYTSIYFPPGSGGYLRIQLWYNGHQLIPWQRGKWLRGDDLLMPDHGQYPCTEQPNRLTIKGYNLSTLYEHSALVGVEITPFSSYALAEPGVAPPAEGV